MASIDPHDVMRPVNWRWQAATYLVDRNLRLPRSRGDEWLSKAKHFIHTQRTADEQGLLQMQETSQDLWRAWKIYDNHGSREISSLRCALEARLIAGEPYHEICRKTGIPPTTLQFYSKIFYDVDDRLTMPDTIMTVILDEPLKKDPGKPNGMWKLFGYWGGPVVLDFIIHRFNQPRRPEGAKTVAAFFQDDLKAQLIFKANLAIRAIGVNWQTHNDLLNLFFRMIELEKDGDGDNAKESYKASIEAFMRNMPFKRGKPDTVNALTQEMDEKAQALRSEELMLISKQNSLAEDHKRLIASAVFPQPAAASA